MTARPLNEPALHALGERIHQLTNADVPARGSIEQLSAWAHDAAGSAPCLLAARRLTDAAREGGVVFIVTGWHDRQTVNFRIAETDGPPGAAVLAVKLHRAFGVTPVLLTEEALVGTMERVLRAAGLNALRVEEAVAGTRAETSPIHAGAVLNFPRLQEEASAQAEHLLKAYQPVAILSVEVGGADAEGEIWTFRGTNASQATPKFDLLFQQARDRGVLTIGIGDGGNELGFGNIRDHLGSVLQEKRLAPTTPVDVLVTAAVSNWGAYAITACIAGLLGRTELLHDAHDEKRLLEVSADAGLIDGMTGYTTPSADGMNMNVHQSVCALLTESVRQALEGQAQQGQDPPA